MLSAIAGVKQESMGLLKIGGLGFPELGIILAILLVLFGAGRLPQIGSSLGKGLRSFKRGIDGSPDENEPSKVESSTHEEK